LTVQDVIHTIRWTRSQGLPSQFEVLDTFSDDRCREWCGDRSVPDETVTIDPDTAQIQAGATAGDLIEAAQQYGLATTTGTISRLA